MSQSLQWFKKSLQFAASEESPGVSSLTSNLISHDSDVHEVRPQKPLQSTGALLSLCSPPLPKPLGSEGVGF